MIQRGTIVTHAADDTFRAEVLALTTNGQKVYLRVIGWGYVPVSGTTWYKGRMVYKVLPVDVLREVEKEST